MLRVQSIILSIVAVMFTSTTVFSAIEVNNYGQPINSATSRVSVDSGLKVREDRRVGVGAHAAGAFGIMGVGVELNFTPRWSSLLGFGISTEFQTINFQARRILGGEALLPYLGLGFSHWSNNGETEGGIQETNPGYVADQFMTEEERELGTISTSLIYPALGLQYMILNGEWIGVAVNVELDLLIDVSSFESVPTGSMGVSYYF